MKNQETITAKGISGKQYPFMVYPWGTPFNKVAAVYLILKKSSNGNYDVVYVGETEDLSSRFNGHHKQTCFDRHGKTHMAVMPEPSGQARLRVEDDLVRNYNPPCNG